MKLTSETLVGLLKAMAWEIKSSGRLLTYTDASQLLGCLIAAAGNPRVVQGVEVEGVEERARLLDYLQQELTLSPRAADLMLANVSQILVGVSNVLQILRDDVNTLSSGDTDRV